MCVCVCAPQDQPPKQIKAKCLAFHYCQDLLLPIWKPNTYIAVTRACLQICVFWIYFNFFFIVAYRKKAEVIQRPLAVAPPL